MLLTSVEYKEKAITLRTCVMPGHTGLKTVPALWSGHLYFLVSAKSHMGDGKKKNSAFADSFQPISILLLLGTYPLSYSC